MDEENLKDALGDPAIIDVAVGAGEQPPVVDAEVFYYTATYYNSEAGIGHEVVNIAASSIDQVIARIDERCRPVNRVDTRKGAKTGDGDSLQIHKQVAVVPYAEFIGGGRMPARTR